MTKTFVILFKADLKIKTYTSLTGVYAEFDKDELGVSKFTLDRIDFSTDFYENEKIRIELSVTKTANEIIREKEQFI